MGGFNKHRPDYMERRKTISTHVVDTDEMDRIRVWAEKNGISAAAIIRLLVRYGLDRQEDVQRWYEEDLSRAEI